MKHAPLKKAGQLAFAAVLSALSLAAMASDKGSGSYSVITRDDGAKQWAYQGRPLYYWVKDAKPGDRTGDGVNNTWRVARP